MKQKKEYDFLFVLTEESENEGEEFLVETSTLKEAVELLVNDYDFRPEEFRFIERLEIWEGEMLGLDTY